MLALARRDVLDLLSLRDGIGVIVSGRRPDRIRRDEITIFDSSGTALQDVAAAVAVYEKAHMLERGTEVKLED